MSLIYEIGAIVLLTGIAAWWHIDSYFKAWEKEIKRSYKDKESD